MRETGIMIYPVYRDLRGTVIKAGDRAYNKNKREQVENPHIVIGFFETTSGTYAILRAPHSEDYFGEPCVELEKYEEFEPSSEAEEKKDIEIQFTHEKKEIEIKIRGV